MSTFLQLGSTPDESLPGRKTYPPEVWADLECSASTIIAQYPQPRSALLGLLHLVQSEDSCLTPAGIDFCARQLGLTRADVAAVATFYSMYRRSPTGEYLVGVCTNTLCAVLGGDAILDALEEHLGITAGQTTPDAKVTLERVECNAACDYAPVVMINWEFFDNQSTDSAVDLVNALREGRQVTPTRGAPLCTFRETSRTLAGVGHHSGDVHPAGAPTLAGLRAAQDDRRPEHDANRR